MKFGPHPTRDSLGAILAHSLDLSGKRLRKGQILEQAQIDALLQAGHDNIIVARLDDSDLHEDTAAAMFADALTLGADLDLSAPFTGRVNVTARGAGVAVINADAINAANSVNPMISVATVPAFQQVSTGNMIGTIKIIAYGVPAVDVMRASNAARGAIGFAAPKLKTATLVVTDVAGGAGHKGVDAIEARLNALTINLTKVITVPHKTANIAKELLAASTDLILILTASATSDPFDVAPEAVRKAGGQITRFGMPVDPGNLLFVGKIGHRSVIGLPGCARSPALNGTDWVLSRIACGIEVTSQDIAQMGVGGLLKEIPTRPMPRRPRS